MSWFWRIRLMILGVVVLVLLCFGAYWGVIALLHSAAAAPFKAHMTEYLAPPTGPVAGGPSKGKMIVIDRKAQAVDDLFFELPDALRAGKPEEVGTVVLIDWSKEKIDQYKNGAPAYQHSAKVTVIDHAARAVIGSSDFKGDEPPMEIDSNASEGNGSKPTKEIIHYLTTLPRQ